MNHEQAVALVRSLGNCATDGHNDEYDYVADLADQAQALKERTATQAHQLHLQREFQRELAEELGAREVCGQWRLFYIQLRTIH